MVREDRVLARRRCGRAVQRPRAHWRRSPRAGEAGAGAPGLRARASPDCTTPIIRSPSRHVMRNRGRRCSAGQSTTCPASLLPSRAAPGSTLDCWNRDLELYSLTHERRRKMNSALAQQWRRTPRPPHSLYVGTLIDKMDSTQLVHKDYMAIYSPAASQRPHVPPRRVRLRTDAPSRQTRPSLRSEPCTPPHEPVFTSTRTPQRDPFRY